MTNELEALSDDALREIEAVMNGDDFGAKYVTASIDNVMALCATVRALRDENSTLKNIGLIRPKI